MAKKKLKQIYEDNAGNISAIQRKYRLTDQAESLLKEIKEETAEEEKRGEIFCPDSLRKIGCMNRCFIFRTKVFFGKDLI